MISHKRNQLFFDKTNQNLHQLKNGMYAIAFSLLKNEQESIAVIDYTLNTVRQLLAAKPYTLPFTRLKPFVYKTLIRECFHAQNIPLSASLTACGCNTVSCAPAKASRFADTACLLPAGADCPKAQSAWEAIYNMEPMLRTMTLMFYLENMRASQIAKTLGVPVKNVKSAIAAARSQLKTFAL